MTGEPSEYWDIRGQLKDRKRYRDDQNWVMADILRKDLEDRGWRVEDIPAGTWTMPTCVEWSGWSRHEHSTVVHEDGTRTHAERWLRLQLVDPAVWA